MLYAEFYNISELGRKEEAACQKLIAKRLLQKAVKKEYGIDISDEIILCGPHGKPYFEAIPVRFSLTHCSGLVCCALGQKEIGIDTETVRPYSRHLAERICTAGELAVLEAAVDKALMLTKFWTLKESLMKLSGEGMRYGFKNAEFSFQNGAFTLAASNIYVSSFALPSGHIVSACSLERKFEQIQT